MPIAIINVFADGLDIISNGETTSTEEYTPALLKSTQAQLVSDGYQVFTHFQD